MSLVDSCKKISPVTEKAASSPENYMVLRGGFLRKSPEQKILVPEGYYAKKRLRTVGIILGVLLAGVICYFITAGPVPALLQ